MLMRVKTPRPSGTITKPCLTKSQAPWPWMSLPKYSMLPEVAAKVPVIAFMVVVLPAPLEPIRDTNSPSRTSKLMPLTACMPP